jgi:hypothetical protein
MPKVAEMCAQKSPKDFRLSWGFIDKSVLRALGGVWHKKHMVLDIVPYKSIDKVASWAKSAYHDWRFGYGLQYNLPSKSLPCISPVSACVTSASTKDYSQLDTLLYYIKGSIGVLIGDAGYFSLKVISLVANGYRFTNTELNPIKT